MQRADYPRLVNLADKYNLWTDDVATYPAMFGRGDGNKTFLLPDWRGIVSRFVDDGKGYDVGRVLGSYQADEFKSHTHTYLTPQRFSDNDRGGSSSNWSIDGNGTYSTSETGGTETRIKNISVMAVMRY